MAGKFYRKGKTTVEVKVGTTVTISKTIQVTRVNDGYQTVKADDGKTYNLNDWDVSYAPSKDLPVRVGDVWEAKNIRYAAFETSDGEIRLRAMTHIPGILHDPNDEEWFNNQNPVLVSRSEVAW